MRKRFQCYTSFLQQTLDAIGLSAYPVTDLVLCNVRLWQYLKFSVPPNDFETVKCINALGGIINDLEKQRREAEAMLYDIEEDDEEWKK